MSFIALITQPHLVILKWQNFLTISVSIQEDLSTSPVLQLETQPPLSYRVSSHYS